MKLTLPLMAVLSAALLTLGAPVTAHAQSLADVARQQRAERQNTPQTRVYTNLPHKRGQHHQFGHSRAYGGFALQKLQDKHLGTSPPTPSPQLHLHFSFQQIPTPHHSLINLS